MCRWVTPGTKSQARLQTQDYRASGNVRILRCNPQPVSKKVLHRVGAHDSPDGLFAYACAAFACNADRHRQLMLIARREKVNRCVGWVNR